MSRYIAAKIIGYLASVVGDKIKGEILERFRMLC